MCHLAIEKIGGLLRKSRPSFDFLDCIGMKYAIAGSVREANCHAIHPSTSKILFKSEKRDETW
jgi:hypothetical protein